MQIVGESMFKNS